ncbi:MAG: MFS transporter, partial [Candidatus Heimdallarchaeota archaeon]
IFGAYHLIVLNDLKASALIIGVVLTMRNFTQIFLRIPFSELSQIVGRKPLIIAGNICYTVGLGLMYLSTHWTLVFLSSTSVGVGMSLHWPAFFSYVGDIADGDYGRLQGIIFMGQDIGILLGAVLAAYLLSNDIVTVKGLFGISFLIMVIAMVFSILLLPEVLEDEHRRKVDSKIKALNNSFRNMLRSIVQLTKDYSLRTIYLFELLFTFAEFFVSSFVPLLIVVSLGYDDSVVAQVILGSTLLQIFFKPYFGKIFDKFGFRGPVVVSMIITSLMIYLLTITNTFWQLLAVYTILMSSILIGYISSAGATSNAALPAQRGLAMGVLGVYISMGRTSSSIILSPILEFLEIRSNSRSEGLIDLFTITAIIIVVITLLLTLYSQGLNSKIKKIKRSEFAITHELS